MADEDWLNGSDDDARREQHDKAVEFARNYEIFRTDPRGIELLKHWDAAYRRKRTPVDAPVQVYAADAAVREFIQGIYDQIDLAAKG